MKAVCGICPRRCSIEEGQTGFCGARANIGGKVVCKNYGMLTSLALDPIEKKPLRRFYPGSYILSAGSFGCNLRCPFCQNHDISMDTAGKNAVYMPPEALVKKAEQLMPRGNIGIAYTYNEPVIGFEYVLDCARLARSYGMKNVLVTNGTICKEPLLELLDYIDAVNIDLKGFSQEFYDAVGGDFETVKRTIELCAGSCHVELTTLIIPGMNDSAKSMERQSKYIASISRDIPLHISRFFPRYKMMDIPATPVETIYALAETAKKALAYVYTGNC